MSNVPPPVNPQQPVKKGISGWLIALIVGGVGCFGLVILSAILFPVFSQAKLSAQKSKGMRNYKDVAMAVYMYATDNDNKYPHEFNSNRQLRRALQSYGVSEELYETNNPDGSQMLPNGNLEGLGLFDIVDPHATILLYDSGVWPGDKYIAAYADGTVGINDVGFEPMSLDVYVRDEEPDD